MNFFVTIRLNYRSSYNNVKQWLKSVILTILHITIRINVINTKITRLYRNDILLFSLKIICRHNYYKFTWYKS
jgi:hypothetical protein